MNREFNEIEQHVINELKTAKRLNKDQQTLLELLNQHQLDDEQQRAFNVLLDALTSIERAKRAISNNKKKMRDLHRAQTQQTRKQRAKKMIDVCADLMKIGIVDNQTADYAIDRKALLGFLLMYKENLNSESSNYAEYVQIADQYLNEQTQQQQQHATRDSE